MKVGYRLSIYFIFRHMEIPFALKYSRTSMYSKTEIFKMYIYMYEPLSIVFILKFFHIVDKRMKLIGKALEDVHDRI